MLLTDIALLDYKRCQRRAFLNYYGDPQQTDPEKDFLLKLRMESQNHINRTIAELYPHAQRLPDGMSRYERSQITQTLMAQGVECIYLGVLRQSLNNFLGIESLTLMGMPHLLVKYPGQSKFGNWSYGVINIHLARRPKGEYKLTTAFHAQLLENIQGTLPPLCQIIVRPQKFYHVDLDLWIPKMEEVLQACFSMLSHRQEPEVFISRQRCHLCHWYSHCYNLAQSSQHLSLVPGVTPSRYESLQILGVESVESLASACPVEMGKTLGLDIATQLKQQAQSIVENRPISKPNSRSHNLQIIPTAPIELYFDVEAEPELNLDYLLGVLLVDREQNTQQFYPFLAENPDQEGLIWSEFLTFVHKYPDAPIFHYSEYEVETLNRLGSLYQTPTEKLDKLLSRCVDLHKQVITLVTLPVESYSLKSLANWLGFQWRDVGVGGDQCVCWYSQWLTTGSRSLLGSILRYNEDDCIATFHLKNWLVQFLLTQTE